MNQGGDYLEYLRPFILQVLVDHRPDPVTNATVHRLIKQQFGLEIPERSIQIILKRISKKNYLKKHHGVYRISNTIRDPQLVARQAESLRHISAFMSGLLEYSKSTARPLHNDSDAIRAICSFLSLFDVKCLRAYIRGTAIPAIENEQQTDVVLVSDFVQNLQRSNPSLFESLHVIVQGHMLANALMCPDLDKSPKSYSRVTFYFDTPLLIQLLGLEGEAKQNAVQELVSLLLNLGGKVSSFSHTREELQGVIKGAAEYLDRSDGRGGIVIEARKLGRKKSDLLLAAENADEKLNSYEISEEHTPRYVEELQIDESVFEQVLGDEVIYNNPRAREYDINSVRSVYVLRGKKAVRSIEKSGAVLVTSNTSFATAAWEYGQKHDASKNVSSVITDFSLANMAWLKAPIGAPDIPTTQILSIAYAALKPSKELLNKYMREIDRLEYKGDISVQDHQLLRSSPHVIQEIMHLTLGDDTILTSETVTDTLERVYSVIKRQESKKLVTEQEAHLHTKNELSRVLAHNRELIKGIYWKCEKHAKYIAVGCSVLYALLLVSGVGFGFRLIPESVFPEGAVVLIVIATLFHIIFGTTVRNAYFWFKNGVLTKLLKKKANELKIKSDEFTLINWDQDSV